jgi:dipeptidyl aminopeptidase/acylaminoacyl peptidase
MSPMKIQIPIVRFLALAAGVALGLGTALLWATPRIIAFRPAAGEPAGGMAAITIRFSTAMDPACASRHIFISPAVAGHVEWQGNTYLFLTDSPWPAGSAVSARVSAGACSMHGLPLLWDANYSFTPLSSRVAYLQTVDGDSVLYAASADSGAAEVLLSRPHALLGFDPSPRGDQIAYAEQTPSGADLWVLDLASGATRRLLDCGQDACADPSFSPDGTQLAFQRGVPPASQVSVWHMAQGAVTDLSAPGHAATSPIWNPRGWLSYFDAGRQAIVLDDLHGGVTFLPAIGGANWSWSPDGESLVIPEIVMTAHSDSEQDGGGSDAPARMYTHLVRIRVSDNQTVDLSGDLPWDDASPSFSPDGRQLAFARQQTGEQFTFGRQLWVLDAAGGQARALSSDGEYNYSAIRWSADGARLAYMRFHMTAPLDPPEVWISEADGTNPRRLVAGGYLPRWLP